MALAAVTAGAVKIGAMVGKTAIGVTKVAGSTIRSGAKVGSRATAKGAKKVNAGLKKAILQRKRVQANTFLKNQRRKRRDVELQKRNTKEQELEKRSIIKGGKGIQVPTIARNPLQALIEFLSTILIGWLINKLPQIIEWAEKLIEFVKKTVKIIGSFFSNLKDALSNIVDLFKNTAEAIKNFDFADKDKKIRDSFDKLKESFNKMGKDIEDGKKLLKETTQKSPQEIMSQERSELMSDPDQVKSEIERVRTGETPTVQPQTPMTGDLFGANAPDLKTAIRRAESGNNYGATFTAYLNGFSRRNEDITNMSINQVVQYQKDYIAHQRNMGIPESQRSAAVGAYQMLYPEEAARATGIPLTAKFNKENQDRMSDYYLNMAGYQQFITGKISAEQFNNRLAGQFASLKTTSGMGVYDSDGINNAYANVLDLIKKRKFDSTSEVSSSPLPRAETNLKMNTTSEDIVVIDEQPVPISSPIIRGSSSVVFIPVGPSLNSMLKQQLLLDLAYT